MELYVWGEKFGNFMELCNWYDGTEKLWLKKLLSLVEVPPLQVAFRCDCITSHPPTPLAPPVITVFSERELMFMFAICRRPFVCRLSVVCRLSSVVCRL